MFKWLTRIVGGSREERLEAVHDPILGSIRRGSDGDWWECQASVAGGSVRFKLGGGQTPDAALIAHARDIVATYAEFKQMIDDFLKEESMRSELADEIRLLRIDDICLFWPRKPDDGMIFFKGPSEDRVWRCDYSERKPTGLGFDS